MKHFINDFFYLMSNAKDIFDQVKLVQQILLH